MKFCLTIILITCWFTSFNQNLVPNPGFEKYNTCPFDYLKPGEVFALPGWYSPSLGTPDYFNKCSEGECQANDNWAGISREHYGDGYVGIISFMTNPNYREYLASELLKPLDSGAIYFLKFSFRLSSYSLISSGNIGLAFTDKRIDARHDNVLSLAPALLAMRDSSIVKLTGTWQTISGNYLANGREKHLILGNFFGQHENPFYKILFAGDNEPMLRNASYFYIDEVIVHLLQEFIPTIPLAQVIENPFKADSVITLHTVQFPYNSAVMLPGKETELEALVKFLMNNALAKIEILGHTDDQGSNEFNNQLSFQRAKSILDYLVGRGVQPNRLVALGFGKSLPLIKATDEMARSKNRRVEVKLVR